MAALKKFRQEGAGEARDGHAKGADAQEKQNQSAQKAQAHEYRFKILRSKMPARRFVLLGSKGHGALSALARALRLAK